MISWACSTPPAPSARSCTGSAAVAHCAPSSPPITRSGPTPRSCTTPSRACARSDDYPWGWPSERYELFLAGFEEAWLRQEGIERRNPGVTDNPRYHDWFARYVRLAASPWMARRLAELNADMDIRPLLGRIRAPCLVVCRSEDVWLSPENSRYLAGQIPGARLVELPGVDHDPWVGDTEPVLAAVEEFVQTVASQGFPKVAARSSRERTTTTEVP